MQQKYNSKDIIPDFFSAFFMFPFGFHSEEGDRIIEAFDDGANGWVMHDYDLSSGLEYNEYVYFYPYIWSIIFETGSIGDHHGVRFFRNERFDGDTEAYYEVENDKLGQIKLPLRDIFLHLFDTGIGILVFEIVYEPEKAEKPRYYNLSDYLFFLSNGRRIYLPFIFPDAEKEDGHFRNAFIEEDDGRSNAIAAKECASEIRVQIGQEVLKHPFGQQVQVHLSKDATPRPHKTPKFWPKLNTIITKFLESESFSYKNYDFWPIIDDRMLVHSFYGIREKNKDELTIKGNCAFLEELKTLLRNDIMNSERNDAMDLWYQMIFIDPVSPSCQNDAMMKKLIFESSYNRWSNWGTFFGFSRFSSATISNIKEARYVYNHFQSMYYQIAILLLFYRGALLTFSHRSEILAKTIHGRGRKGLGGNFLNHLQRLHEDFILFRNKYWFREVTAQDQGIEIFDVWSRKLRNKELLEDVQAEIKELYLYVESSNEKNISKKINILTIIGALFLPIVIATSFFGMNFALIDEDVMTNFVRRIVSRAFGLNLGPVSGEVTTFIAITVIVLILLVIAYFMLRKPWKT